MRILKKDAKKDFVILNLTDTQLGDEDWKTKEGRHRIVLEHAITTLIERVRPDLITISGDLAWAGNDVAYKSLADFLDSFQIPWAPVWGNHDQQDGTESVHRTEEELLKHKYCLYEKGDEALGYGNYVIGIEEEGRLVSGIFLLDSHDRVPYTDSDGKEQMVWAKLIPEQLDWYREQVLALKEQGCEKTVMILHIPIYAYRTAAVNAWKKGTELKKLKVKDSYGTECWENGYEASYGVMYEEVGCYPEDDGVFELLKELNSTKLIVAGHDHVNNTVIDYQGIVLAYGLKTGAGCYWHESLNGGTVLNIQGNGDVAIRHEYVDAPVFIESIETEFDS